MTELGTPNGLPGADTGDGHGNRSYNEREVCDQLTSQGLMATAVMEKEGWIFCGCSLPAGES
jgi:hypothetical protein